MTENTHARTCKPLPHDAGVYNIISMINESGLIFFLNRIDKRTQNYDFYTFNKINSFLSLASRGKYAVAFQSIKKCMRYCDCTVKSCSNNNKNNKNVHQIESKWKQRKKGRERERKRVFDVSMLNFIGKIIRLPTTNTLRLVQNT